MRFDKYKQNLQVLGDKVYSYDTHVATIVGNTLRVREKYHKYSPTTSKHINYVADELGLFKIIEKGDSK